MKPLNLTLSEKERLELSEVLKTHSKSYMRERASALLQITSGKSGRWVAVHGLLALYGFDNQINVYICIKKI